MAKKVLLVASGGGHWVQLGRLAGAFADDDTLFVTTLAGSVASAGDRPVTVVPDASRSAPLRLLALFVRMAATIVRFRPDLVVTTGAAPGLLAIQIGRLWGARTVWVDSVANSEDLSLSGKLAARSADLWLTQWEDVAAMYDGLEFRGRVF